MIKFRGKGKYVTYEGDNKVYRISIEYKKNYLVIMLNVFEYNNRLKKVEVYSKRGFEIGQFKECPYYDIVRKGYNVLK